MRAALGFLTVLPVAGPVAGAERRMLLTMPLVGALVGMVWAATASVFGRGLPVLAVAAAVIAVDLALTGALHLDAVGDVGDAYAARRSGADPVVAMTDPRLGAVGAATLVATLLVRVGLVAALVVSPWSAGLWLVPIVGRAGMVAALWASPGRTGSVAGALARAATGAAFGGVVALTVAAAAVAVVAGVRPAATAVAVVAGLGVATVVTRRAVAAVGRPGGDLIGAAGIAAETVVLLALAWRG